MASPLVVPASSGTGGASATAIVGDNPTPYGSAVLGGSVTDALTTEDLSVGDPGEFGNLAEFAIEFWFQIVSTLAGADNSIVYGPVSNSGASRQLVITVLAAGTMFMSVTDEGAVGRSVTGSTVLQPNQWYHIVCTAQGGNLIIYLNGVADGTSATWGAHTVRPLGTTAGSLNFELVGPTIVTNYYFDELAVYRTGMTAARVLEHYNAGRNKGFPAQLPGERIGAILDNVSSHAPRSLQLGTRTVIPRYMSGQAPLEEMRRAVEAEDVDAALFVTKGGTVKFLADGHRSSAPYNTVQATYGDAGGGELPYLAIETDYSDGELINEWNLTRTAYQTNTPVTQTASDATSISRYLKRSRSLSDVPTTTDGNCATIAAALLAKYKDPFQRVTSISPNMADPDTCLATLGLELMDRVRVLWTPPGGGARFDQTVFVQSIKKSWAPGQPISVTLGVSPL